MDKKRIVIGIITFCREDMDLRFQIMQKALPELEKLKSENVYFTLWDNNSCEKVKTFLNSLDFIDYKYFSDKNFYDVAPIQFLSRAGKKLNTDYVCHMEDDLLICNENSMEELQTLMDWMDQNDDIGGSRILRWEIDNIEKYNKRGSHPKLDRANMQTHLNVATGEKLKIDEVCLYDLDSKEEICRVAKTNWHWYNFPVVCKTSVYQDIIPVGDIEPLQAQEGYMMKKYAETQLSLGAHDGGLVTHLAPPTPNSKTSARHHMKNVFAKLKDKPENMGTEVPVMKMKDVLVEVEKAIEGLNNE